MSIIKIWTNTQTKSDYDSVIFFLGANSLGASSVIVADKSLMEYLSEALYRIRDTPIPY